MEYKCASDAGTLKGTFQPGQNSAARTAWLSQKFCFVAKVTPKLTGPAAREFFPRMRRYRGVPLISAQGELGRKTFSSGQRIPSD